MSVRTKKARSIAVLSILGAAAASLLLGASCNSGSKESVTAPPGTAPVEQSKGAEDTLEQLKGVDVSDLTANERARWVDLVNTQLSPCGDPISVARCVAEQNACGSCVPAARYLVRLVAEGFDAAEIREYYTARYDASAKLDIPVEGAPVRGAPMAPVSIVEFSDFECPYCGAAHPMLQRLLEQYEGRVKLVFKNYPLEGHKSALPAAHAAVAAQLQGKFWQMADLLFEHQHELSDEKVLELAKQAGLDMEKFEADLNSEAVIERVAQDRKDGKALEVAGTPTLFIDGRRFQEPLQNLGTYLAEELGR